MKRLFLCSIVSGQEGAASVGAVILLCADLSNVMKKLHNPHFAERLFKKLAVNVQVS